MRIQYRRWGSQNSIFTDSYGKQLYCAKFEAELLYSLLPEINPIQELRKIPLVAQFAIAERTKEAVHGSELVQLENAIQPLLPIINQMAGPSALSNKETSQLINFRSRYVNTYFASPLPVQTEPEGVNQNTPMLS